MTLATYDFSTIGQSAKTTRWGGAFNKFTSNLTIDSKETGVGPLKLYKSQQLFMDQIAVGLDNDIHDFTVLKARQLGQSTVTLALDLFWPAVFPGTQGALVSDDEANRDQFRETLSRYYEGLPKGYRVKQRVHNRNLFSFSNGSRLNYLVAGTKKKGSFGQGRGLSLVHATELSRYGDAKAWASFVSALAEQNPNRLYIKESTARGYDNIFPEVWERAIDSTEQLAIFIGWWAKETYRIEQNTRQYDAMMSEPLTDDEHEKIKKVKDEYNVEIGLEQVAWYRAKEKDLLSKDEGYVAQEFPWTADEAFQETGKPFFPRKSINVFLQRSANAGYLGYRFHMGETFDTMEVEQIKPGPGARHVELRVWEQPSRFGRYAIGADPAYGSAERESSWHDYFAINVLRCYADRVVQVAEYAVTDINPARFAWVLAHLGGYFGNVRLNLELNGPGGAVHQELLHVQRELKSGPRAANARAKGIDKTFDNIAAYLYHRMDSLGAGYAYYFKSTQDSKSQIYMRLKDYMIQNMIDIRSLRLVEEMEKIVSDHGWIGAGGRHHDDRTFSLALALKAHDDWLRPTLNAEGMTYEKVREKEAEQKRIMDGSVGKATVLSSHIISTHFANARKPVYPMAGEWDFQIREGKLRSA